MSIDYYPQETKYFEAIRPEIEGAINDHISRTNRKTISLDPYQLTPLEAYVDLKQRYDEHLTHWAGFGLDIAQVIRNTSILHTATEENLPWYTASLFSGFDEGIVWVRRWTTEEKSHGELMLRDIEARGILNMSLEWLPVREANMNAGTAVSTNSIPDIAAYAAPQELLTRVAHFNAARYVDEPHAKNLRLIGSDEGRHYKFYLTMMKALGQEFPDIALAAMRHHHDNGAFEMPGQKGILNYTQMAREIAVSGVFDAIMVLKAQKQTIDEAGLLTITPKTDQGKKNQEWAFSVSSEENKAWQRSQKLTQLLRERAVKNLVDGPLKPLILGYNVIIENNKLLPIAA